MTGYGLRLTRPRYIDRMIYRLTQHAKDEMTRREVTVEQLESALAAIPGQPGHGGREVRQAISGGYLVRAVIETGDPLLVVTVYRTSKLRKYGVAP